MIDIKIDSTKKYQVIDNFGASGAWSIDPIGKEWEIENKEKIADLLFSLDKGIGLSCWRFNFGAGSDKSDKDIITAPNEWRRSECFKESEEADYDWSKHEGQRYFLKAAKDRGVNQFVAMVYSPPVWMTKNGHGQPDETVGTTNLKDNCEGKLAKFIVDILKHFRDEEGIEFNYISPVNEPNWEWNKSSQEGCRFSNEDLKKVINALYDELQRQGVTSKIMINEAGDIVSLLDDENYHKIKGNTGEVYNPSNIQGKYSGKYREYIKDFLNDETINYKIDNMLCAHSYWTDHSKPGEDMLLALRRLVRENIDKYMSKARYWQSEYCILGEKGPKRDLGIDSALWVARTIHYDLTALNASAWHWWLSVSPHDYKDGLIYTDYLGKDKRQNVLPSKMLWALGNYSKFIRPGAYRIELSGADDENRLMGSAYINEVDRNLTAVFINYSDDDELIELHVDNLPTGMKLGKVRTYVTSDIDEDNIREKKLAKDEVTYTIPKRSVVTFLCSYSEEK